MRAPLLVVLSLYVDLLQWIRLIEVRLGRAARAQVEKKPLPRMVRPGCCRGARPRSRTPAARVEQRELQALQLALRGELCLRGEEPQLAEGDAEASPQEQRRVEHQALR